jgi:hypothetical protein
MVVSTFCLILLKTGHGICLRNSLAQIKQHINRIWIDVKQIQCDVRCMNNTLGIIHSARAMSPLSLYHMKAMFLICLLDVGAHLRFASLEKTVLHFLIYFVHRFTLIQMCVRILLIFISAMCSTELVSGTDAHTDANILLSVKEQTYSSCLYVLYNGEQGTLFRMLHNELHERHEAECVFTIL